MNTVVKKQGTTFTLAAVPGLRQWIDGFIVSRRAGGAAPSSVTWYAARLEHFRAYCAERNLDHVESLDPGLIREYLLALEDAGHNPGGRHGYFRAVRAFFKWYEDEALPDGWRNPIDRVKAPKVPDKALDPASTSDINALLAVCEDDLNGLRDKAILLTLLDTGARAAELTAFTLADLDPVTGSLIVQHGKGDKRRAVFLGQKARRAVRAYLRARGNKAAGPLFATRSGGRLKYFGLRAIVARLAARAGVKPPPLHSFRRAFAIEALRAGADLLTLQRLLGHADMSILKRYANQSTADLQRVHAAVSPADRL